ncbi:MAG: ABC transporter ATP-binding protein [Dehalococcoidia bacterium]
MREATRRMRAPLTIGADAIRAAEERTRLPIARLLLFVLVVSVPFWPMIDSRWLRILVLVGIFVVLGLGLNIVVGYAGLLDLGFVAFFATGAYSYAILASPASPALQADLNWWLAIPIALTVGAAVGVMLGVPVLPLRGDYLAIVTLGFGEIIRILLLNVRGLTNGAQGLFNIPPPQLGGWVLKSLEQWYWLLVVSAFLIAIAVGRMRASRMGRAWEAIREDEDVAAGMGVSTVKYKLMAFAMGASVGAFGGLIFAGFFQFVNPSSFTLLVSVNVLSIVVIGGMGSTPGVVFGALILIGLPEVMQFSETERLLSVINPAVPFADTTDWGRQLASARFIVFGVLLVAVMALRPGGLFPAQRAHVRLADRAEAAA